MSLFQQLSDSLKPHADRASSEFAFHMASLHNKLAAIERAVSDLGKGDIGDHWQRFQIKRKFEAGERFEIAVCPINEIWLIQAIATDGVQEKSPAFVIEANNVLLESVIKEGLGFEGISGSQVVMRGERLSILARAEGPINCTITIIRRTLPTAKVMTDYGKGTERFSPKQIHEVERDVILSRTDQYREPAQATAPSEGRTG